MNLPEELSNLPIPERLDLIEALWDSIDIDTIPPSLTPEKRRELDRRLADHREHPGDVVPWEQIKADALARFGK